MSKFQERLHDCKFVDNLKEVLRDFMSDVDARLKRIEEVVFMRVLYTGAEPGAEILLDLRTRDTEILDPPYVPAEESLAPAPAEAATDAPSDDAGSPAEDLTAEDAEEAPEQPSSAPATEVPEPELNKPAKKRRKA